MRRGQMTTMDLSVAVVILLLVFSLFIIATTRYINNYDRENKVDTYILYESLESNLASNNTYIGRRVDFMNRSVVNLTRLSAFGNISHSDPEGFKRYFFDGTEIAQTYDISMFIMNASYDYINISGNRFAYGNVSNSSTYDTTLLNDSQRLIMEGKQPCHHYDEAFSIVKPIYVNNTYLNLYFLFCRIR